MIMRGNLNITGNAIEFLSYIDISNLIKTFLFFLNKLREKIRKINLNKEKVVLETFLKDSL